MAVGSGPLDEPLVQTEVNKAVICHPLQLVESQLSSLCQKNHLSRYEAAGNYMAIVPGQGGSAS